MALVYMLQASTQTLLVTFSASQKATINKIAAGFF